jgi:hypothetical protein
MDTQHLKNVGHLPFMSFLQSHFNSSLDPSGAEHEDLTQVLSGKPSEAEHEDFIWILKVL